MAGSKESISQGKSQTDFTPRLQNFEVTINKAEDEAQYKEDSMSRANQKKKKVIRIKN